MRTPPRKLDPSNPDLPHPWEDPSPDVEYQDIGCSAEFLGVIVVSAIFLILVLLLVKVLS